ncbi:MAG: GNAT family acetyltransferase [Pseudomonadota bacterium]
MIIRKYKDDDHDALVQLWSQVFPNDPPHNDPRSVIAAKRAVDDLIFVVVDDNNIIGACMAGYDGHRGWLYSVAVQEHNRRQGTGAALVKHAVNTLRELGCIKINLQIRAGNEAVADFYRSLGFIAEERISMGILLQPPPGHDESE